jgi:hypothetical protein
LMTVLTSTFGIVSSCLIGQRQMRWFRGRLYALKMPVGTLIQRMV